MAEVTPEMLAAALAVLKGTHAERCRKSTIQKAIEAALNAQPPQPAGAPTQAPNWTSTPDNMGTCLGVFAVGDRVTGPIVGQVVDGIFQNHLGQWPGVAMVMPLELPSAALVKKNAAYLAASKPTKG